MKLAKEAFQALEEIVGSEYITQEPVILETYNQVWGNKFFFDEKHSTRPAAVLLPAKTEEIQEVVRICNKYGILFKAFSSGFEYLSLALESEKAILFDLRRMNRILEIDARNMRAIVEPYVSAYQLQLEAAKYGLFTGRIGVGYNAGVIAAECCHHGGQHTILFTSGYGRNVLGVEWVLPNGELLKLGSGENSDDLFSADGPGLSLRGILRGRTGANGGHGVITKASVKLYPWYGPSEWEQTKEYGQPPSHGQIKKVPDGYKVFIATFPTINHALEATIDFCHSEILCAMSISMLNTGVLPEGNDEEYELMQEIPPEIEDLAKSSLVLVIGGEYPGILEYREKCVLALTQKWGGRFLLQFNEPKGLARSFADLIWSTGVQLLRTTGDFLPSSSSPDGSPDMLKKLSQQEGEAAAPYEQSGALFHRGSGQRPITWRPEEQLSVGAQGISVALYDPYDPSSLEAARNFANELFNPLGKFRRFGITSRGGCLQIESVTHVHQNWGRYFDNYDVWLRKIKKMLDPNTVADWSAYIPPEYSQKGDYIPPSYGKNKK